MLEKLEQIREEGFNRIAETSDMDKLEAIRKELTGKNFEAGKVALMTINGFEKVEEIESETITYTWTADGKIGFITGFPKSSFNCSPFLHSV